MIFVSGSAEAEGNGRFHQRPQYDRDRFLRRQQTLYTLHQQGLMIFLVLDGISICHSCCDDRFIMSEVGGAAAAEKEQKKQEHQVDTT